MNSFDLRCEDVTYIIIPMTVLLMIYPVAKHLLLIIIIGLMQCVEIKLAMC